MVQLKDETPPALFIHCKNTYNAMLEEASEVEFDKDSKGIVYEGKLTALITEKLYLSVPYYTKIRAALIAMGCVKQLRRGGGSAPSQWELFYEPTIRLYNENVRSEQLAEKAAAEEKKNALAPATQQQISDLQRQIDEVNEALKIIVNSLPEES